jgi:hypothetical protein
LLKYRRDIARFSFRRRGEGPAASTKIEETTMKALRNVTLALAGLVAVGAASVAVAQPVGGMKHRTTTVSGLSSDTFQVTFQGSQLAMITVSGDGDSDLDVYVYDELGNLIASDEDGSDQCLVAFTPRWTGRFTIRVVNRGLLPNLYTIIAS